MPSDNPTSVLPGPTSPRKALPEWNDAEFNTQTKLRQDPETKHESEERVTKSWKFCPLQWTFVPIEEACLCITGRDGKTYLRPPKYCPRGYWPAFEERQKNGAERDWTWCDWSIGDVASPKATMETCLAKAREELRDVVYKWLEGIEDEKSDEKYGAKKYGENKSLTWSDKTIESGLENTKQNLRNGFSR